MWILREKRTGKPLNVSYTPEGLKYTSNKMGRLLLYDNGKLVRLGDRIVIQSNNEKPLKLSDKVYIERYVPPQLEVGNVLYKMEFVWAEKAYKMLYHVEN